MRNKCKLILCKGVPMKKAKIYLDICCFNRPYDDQDQLRIELETKAKLHIQQQIVDGKYILVSSVILDFENSVNPYPLRKYVVNDFLKYAEEYVEEDISVVEIAKGIASTGVKPKDASHVACAIFSGCDYFLTTDDRLLKYKDNRIKILNPVDFVVKDGEM